MIFDQKSDFRPSKVIQGQTSVSNEIFECLGEVTASTPVWEDYLNDYGTGHFDRTFLICNANEGINEMELYFLRHLIHNKRLTKTTLGGVVPMISVC